MLTFKLPHEPIVDGDNGLIEIWDDERNAYEKHSFEFIEDLYKLYVFPAQQKIEHLINSHSSV